MEIETLELILQPEIVLKSPLAKHAKQPLQTIIPKAPRDGKQFWYTCPILILK